MLMDVVGVTDMVYIMQGRVNDTAKEYFSSVHLLYSYCTYVCWAHVIFSLLSFSHGSTFGSLHKEINSLTIF